jgi:hypothetical protein
MLVLIPCKKQYQPHWRAIHIVSVSQPIKWSISPTKLIMIIQGINVRETTIINNKKIKKKFLLGRLNSFPRFTILKFN